MTNPGAFNPRQLDAAARAAAIADSDPSVNTVADTSYTATYPDAARYTRFTNAAGCAFHVPLDVFPIGAELPFEQSAAGPVTPTADAGVTINSRGGATATAGQSAVALLKQVARNVWNFTGDIA